MATYWGTRLTCEECGYSYVAKGGAGEGHLQYCLNCDTESPGFEQESVYR